MNKYLGITIGPIYATITQAQKTREFWLGSYFFSYVMKLILREIDQKQYGDILAQDISQLHEDEKLHGAGIYSDRCYVRLKKEFDQEEYDNLVDSLIGQLEVEDKESLKEYLQVYCTIQTISENENVIKILNEQLDIMELQSKYYSQNIYALASGYDNLKKLRQEGEKIILPTNIEGLINKWYELGFDKNNRDDLIHYSNIKNGIYSFPSLLEITTKGLERLNPSRYDAEIHAMFEDALRDEIEDERFNLEEQITEKKILNKIKVTFPENYQTAHKYVAIVTADGDNMGKLINIIAQKNDDKLLEDFSKNISEFARQASKLIYQYGGKPVYIGGDDLVFFAPSISYRSQNQVELEYENMTWTENNTGHIFNLIEVLEKAFNRIWKSYIDDDEYKAIKPSLSYGISITYYKFPLNEAMDLSHELLSENAKKYPPGEKPTKNSIAIQLMTHSGSFDKVIFEKHNPQKSTFYHLLKLLEDFGNKESMISSVLQRLRGDTELILSIAGDGDTFDAYFTNEYDLHNMKDPKKKAFIKHSISLFNEIFAQQKDNPKETLNQLCSMYRLLNFLIHKETENGNEV
jgi:CRISPR-associated protein Cmr2